MAPESKKYHVGVRVWINEDEGHFLGVGRVRLLEHIRDTGSITRGAAAMKMSYRQAWQMVEDMNKRSERPLVEKILGGKGGGGAKLTESGANAIALFYKMEQHIAHFAKELEKEIRF
jgi:molybdate transport system regulatory protein